MKNISISGFKLTKRNIYINAVCLIVSFALFAIPLYSKIQEEKNKYYPFNSGTWGFNLYDEYPRDKEKFVMLNDCKDYLLFFERAFWGKELAEAFRVYWLTNKKLFNVEFDKAAFVAVVPHKLILWKKYSFNPNDDKLGKTIDNISEKFINEFKIIDERLKKNI